MKKFHANFLNTIITRIDYEDQIKILDETLLEVKKICMAHDIDRIENRTMDLERDFSTNDTVPFRDLSEEYVRTVLCKCYYNDEFMIEINPLFVRVIQKSTEKYKNYKESHLPILMEIFKILNVPSEQILRVSAKKVDEVYYENMELMEKYFKEEILQNKFFGEKQNWNIPQSESKITQNFEYDNFRVNFCRYIDRGMIREKCDSDSYKNKILYRLFLDYEVYSRNDVEELEGTLNNINRITEELFEQTFSEKGRDVLYNGGGFENYVFS